MLDDFSESNCEKVISKMEHSKAVCFEEVIFNLSYELVTFLLDDVGCKVLLLGEFIFAQDFYLFLLFQYVVFPLYIVPLCFLIQSLYSRQKPIYCTQDPSNNRFEHIKHSKNQFLKQFPGQPH